MPRRSKTISQVQSQATRLISAIAREGTIGGARAANNRARFSRVQEIGARYQRNMLRATGGNPNADFRMVEAARNGSLNTPVARSTYMGLNNG